MSSHRAGRKPGHAFIRSLKPAAPRWAHYLLAALLWSGVGAFLLFRGLSAALKLDPPLLLAVSLGAAVIGAAKGLRVMRPAALKGAARIEGRGDESCIGGFISWKSWLLVLGMAVMGKYLRSAGLPGWLLGLILGGVGSGLLIGSRVYWSAFLLTIRRPPSR